MEYESVPDVPNPSRSDLPYPLDHIGIAVHSIEEAAPVFERLFGQSGSQVVSLPGQGVDVCFVGAFELLEPRGPDSTVARFLDRSGPGLHHVAYRVVDIRAELDRASANGFRPIDAEPRPGAHGHLVAFLHPKDTGGVLIELVES